jgi:hypothetical protein
MLKNSFLIALAITFCWSIITLASNARMMFNEGIVEIEEGGVTINSADDIEEYRIGIKP